MRPLFHKPRNGFSLIEMLIYIAIVSATGVFMVGLIISFARTFALASVSDDINESASAILERLTLEVQGADGVNGASSTFGDPGVLVLDTEDSDGDPVTRRLYVDSGRIMLQEGSDAPEALSRDRVTVESFTIEEIVTPHSEGVRVAITLSGTRGKIRQVETFRTAALTRSY